MISTRAASSSGTRTSAPVSAGARPCASNFASADRAGGRIGACSEGEDIADLHIQIGGRRRIAGLRRRPRRQQAAAAARPLACHGRDSRRQGFAAQLLPHRDRESHRRNGLSPLAHEELSAKAPRKIREGPFRGAYQTARSWSAEVLPDRLSSVSSYDSFWPSFRF